MKTRTTRKLLTRLSNCAMMAGAVCVGIFGWNFIDRALYQNRENRAFDESVQSAAPLPTTRPAPTPAPAAPPEGSVVGRLIINRLHLRAMVREGTDDRTLDVALGHIKGTAFPGKSGNVAIAGHRDTLFHCLRDINRGDSIVLQTTHGNYTYRVEHIGIVKPRDVEVLDSRSYPALTLVTCYPFRYVGAAPDRMIVRARLVSAPSEPRT